MDDRIIELPNRYETVAWSGITTLCGSVVTDEGIDTIHVSEIGMSEAKDAKIIHRTREEGRGVATLDADFHTLLELDEATSPSVIRIRIERLRAQALTDLFLMVTSECQEELEQASAFTVEPSRIPIHRLPLVPDV